MKVFIDSDIILDVILNREPHYKNSALVFLMAENKKIALYTSTVVYCNVYYLLTRATNKTKAKEVLLNLKSIVSLLPVDDKIITQALTSNFKDYEDAVQNYTAFNNKIKLLLTRNVKDYKNSDVEVVTPEQFLNRYN